ncbi:NAD(P)-dependent oxidoreductase [Streptosporangium sp. NPDC051022]|uniref:NAD(P)-dependent oxidoreductase n=1 Tax=Streptosporangium sp. NPDC051022 TaxID=3155752 RepID=UPI00341C2A4E
MMNAAVIGLGAMGSRIAERLARTGHDIVVWSRSSTVEIPGARLASSPADAARGADVVITMVSDGEALRAVTSGPDGMYAGVGAGTTVIQMSTVDAETTRWLSRSLPAGTLMLDAPVLGSVAEATAGELVLLVSGEDDVVADCEPVLRALGTVHRVGGIGTGTAAKLVANSALFGVIGVLGECLVLARSLGLSDDAAFEVMDHTPLAAQARRRRPAIADGEYTPRFALDMALKDAGLVALAAQAYGIDLRLAEAMRTWLSDASDKGLGDRDYTAVLAHIGVDRPK